MQKTVKNAGYLGRKDWRFSNEELTDILGRNYLDPLNTDILRRILDTVADATSRDLLSRLGQVIYKFGNGEVSAVANATPTINSPLERLDPLLGLWVQYDSEGTYVVSPLAKSATSTNLGADTLRQVNLALGDQILRGGCLDQSDASNALVYYVKAQAYAKAEYLMGTACMALLEQGIPSYDAGLLSVWGSLPLPEGMSLRGRIMIRGLQIQLYSQSEKSVDYLLEDLASLLPNAKDEESPMVFAACASAAIAASAAGNFTTSCQFMGRALGQLETICKEERWKVIVEGSPIVQYAWLSAITPVPQPNLDEWLAAIKRMPADLCVEAMSGEMAEAGCLTIADGPWLYEAEKPLGSRCWPSVRDTLEELAQEAEMLGMELLWASAIRSQIVVLAEYENAADKAISLGKAASDKAKDPRSQFLLCDSIARQLLHKKKNSDAVAWFTKALEQPTDAFPIIRLRTLVHASVAMEPQEHDQAVSYLNQALALGIASDDIPRTELVRTAGELCILEGLNGDLPKAFSALDMVATQLLADRQKTSAWKALFTVTGHTSGYFTTLSCTGSAPETTPSGDPYATPQRGFFLGFNESGCADFYKESTSCMILAQLAQFADSVDASERARHWAFSAIDAAREADLPMVIDAVSLQVIPFMLQDDQYADAIDLSVETARITVAGITLKGEHRSVIGMGWSDVYEALGDKPGERWDMAEQNSVLFGLFPAACRVAMQFLETPETAKRSAKQIIATCRQLCQTASHKKLWAGAADIVEKSFISGVPSQTLSELSETFDSETYSWLRMVGHVGSSIQPDCSLRQALNVHIAVMSSAHQGLRQLSRLTYDRLLVTWITSFWKQRFGEQRFRFHAPSFVADQLDQAMKLPEEVRVQAILRIVVSGLGIRVDGAAADWLRETQ